jgi:signal transduction histidine kinase
VSIVKPGPGIRTRVLFLLCLMGIIAGATATSLYLIRSQLRRQVYANLQMDLSHSVETFQDLEAGRLAALEREDALMAGEPRLKALMTTDDARTIADDAVDFWKTSGNDLFSLADANRHVETAFTNSARNTATLRNDLQAVIVDPSHHYLLSGGQLYEYTVHPLYFGNATTGTLLGYVISGYAIDSAFLREVGRGAGAEAAFLAKALVTVSTLPPDMQPALQPSLQQVSGNRPSDGRATTVMIGRERYLAAGKDLSEGAGQPLRLVVLKSLDSAERAERQINLLVLWVSLLAMGTGAGLMVLLARMVTKPLELLASGVRAFGEGDRQHSLPEDGTREVRYLSLEFAHMRDEIQKTNLALLESERLATIGRMASSVSHDLRHYLAAVYANAEFLASPTLPSSERAELFEEIRLAVNGTTDMLDSLLIFSRTGSALHRVQATLSSIAERAVAMVRTHPDAERVRVILEEPNADTSAAVDTKQIERAVYNLLLNACQSARESQGLREVRVSLQADSAQVSVTIVDSGPGVPESMRESIFDPFVSQGKQRGTGLGLTLAASVAREHDGDVRLMSSRPGETIFRLRVARSLPATIGKPDRSRTRVLTS